MIIPGTKNASIFSSSFLFTCLYPGIRTPKEAAMPSIFRIALADVKPISNTDTGIARTVPAKPVIH